jgi:hypothetical protein
MKKILFVVIFTMINEITFSQSDAIKFMSMGFNAQTDWRGDTELYFYGYDDYSEAIIYDYDGRFPYIELSTKNLGTFYPNGHIEHGFSSYTFRRYTGQNNSIGYSRYIPTQGSIDMEYKLENSRLVYWARGEGLDHGRTPYTILKRIEQNNQSITIHYSTTFDDRSFSERYYNISRTELLDIFLKKYLEIICEIIDIGNTNRKYDYNFEDNYNVYIPALIEGRTARELAIFRNCLYAMKGYRFANPTWTEFFNKYLNGYNGQYTIDEVTAMFTDNEKWLLNLVMQHENRK